MKQRVLLLLILLCTFSVFGQPDTEKKNSIKIPAIPIENKDSSSTSNKIDIKPISNNKISKTDNTFSKFPVKIREIKSDKKKFSMFDDNQLRDPGEMFEKRLNAKLEEQKIKPYTTKDFFYGEFQIGGGIPNIRCRDHGEADGDLIRVIVNGEIFIPQMVLTYNYKAFDVPLKEGRNVVEFIALNQGYLGLNTAEFQVHDDNGRLISHNGWYLSTNKKASFVIMKNSELDNFKSDKKGDEESKTTENEN